MSNQLSNKMLAELFKQDSGDPFLMLVTLNHPEFAQTIRLVSNVVDITSRGNLYQAFPMSIQLSADDPDQARQVTIEFDNVSLKLIRELRTILTPMDVVVEMILASDPDAVQLSYEQLKLGSVNYDKQKVSARLYMDTFLDDEMTSEKYTPRLYPGLF